MGQKLKQPQRGKEGKWSNLCWNKFSCLRIVGECTLRITVRLGVKQVAAVHLDGEK